MNATQEVETIRARTRVDGLLGKYMATHADFERLVQLALIGARCVERDAARDSYAATGAGGAGNPNAGGTIETGPGGVAPGTAYHPDLNVARRRIEPAHRVVIDTLGGEPTPLEHHFAVLVSELQRIGGTVGQFGDDGDALMGHRHLSIARDHLESALYRVAIFNAGGSR